MAIIHETPNGGFQIKRKARYTGYGLDSTSVISADIRPGAIVQACGAITGVALTGSSVQTTAGVQAADSAYAYGQPTVGYNTPFAVVSENIQVSDRATINNQAGVVANLRDGGTFEAIIGGYCRALVVDGAVLVAGITMLAPVTGTFYLKPVSRSRVLYSSVAASSNVNINTNSTTASAFDLSYTLLANSVNVGDVLRIRGKGTFTTTNSTDTAKVTVKLGSQALVVTPTIDTADSDIFTFDLDVKVQTIGTAGTYTAAGRVFAGTAAAAAGAADIASASSVGATPIAINTTTTNAITVTVEHPTSTAGQKTTVLDDLTIEQIAPVSIGGGPIAVAMESVTVSDSTNGSALAKVMLLAPLN